MTTVLTHIASPARLALAVAGFAVAALLALAPRAADAAQPAPHETLIDQTVVTCWYGTHLEVRVVETFTADELVGKRPRGNAQWIVLIVDVTNLDTEDGSGVYALKLRDDRSREFGRETVGTVGADELATQLGVEWENARFSPGITVRSVVTFQVPPDSKSFTLLPDPFQCGA